MTTQHKDKSFRDRVLAESAKGNICYFTVEGLVSVPLNVFITQPADGILYDLNRDLPTILTYIEDPKWVNDYAVALVIKKLKQRIQELEEDRTR